MKSVFNNNNKQSDDGSVFFEKQLREEREMSGKLRLRKGIKETLQSRHSTMEIANFLQQYGSVIATHPYLYMLPGDKLVEKGSVSFRWSETKKVVYSLQDYNY